MEGGFKTSARQASSSTARAFRDMVPSADRARRMQQMHTVYGEAAEATGRHEDMVREIETTSYQ